MDLWMSELQGFFMEHQRVLTICSVLGLIVTNMASLAWWYDTKEELKEVRGEALHQLDRFDGLYGEKERIRTELQNVINTIVKVFGKLDGDQTLIDKIEFSAKRYFNDIAVMKNERLRERDRNVTLEGRNEEIEGENLDLKEEIVQLKVIIDDMEGRLANKVNEVETLVKEKLSLSDELDRVREEIDKVREEILSRNEAERDYSTEIDMLQKSKVNLEKQVRRLTSSRDEVKNQRDIQMAFRKIEQKSFDKSKKTYKAKLDKLRKAIRGEGFTYELDGRKINIYEIEE